MATSDLDEFIEHYHLALNEFFSGNPEPAKTLYSHREDASLANPFGPVTTGWKQVAETMELPRGRGHGLRKSGQVRHGGFGLYRRSRTVQGQGRRQRRDSLRGSAGPRASFAEKTEGGRSCIDTRIR